MDVEQSRGWGIRDTVIAVGVVAGLVFVLIALTGSDIDSEAARTLGTAFGGACCSRPSDRPESRSPIGNRASPCSGPMTVTLSLLACGASVVSVWGDTVSAYGFCGYGGTSGTVGAITDLLALTGLGNLRAAGAGAPGEDDRRTKLVQLAAVGALALLIALAILDARRHQHRPRPQGLRDSRDRLPGRDRRSARPPPPPRRIADPPTVS